MMQKQKEKDVAGARTLRNLLPGTACILTCCGRVELLYFIPGEANTQCGQEEAVLRTPQGVL
jgi:hypothetical protein